VEDWNDHYFLAEERYEIVIEGTLAVTLNLSVEDPKITMDDVEQLLDNAEIEFDEYESITVAEPPYEY
jgi:hypothetical protein